MLLDRLKNSKLYQQQQGDNRGQNSDIGGGSSDNNQQQDQEVDVTEDIQNLLKYVAKKKEDDPHDGVLSRVHSRLKDIVESLIGDSSGGGTDPHTQPPTTPTVTVPDLPQWQFVRKRGGRIVKRPVKQKVK